MKPSGETAIGNLGRTLGGVGVELPKMMGSADNMKAAYRDLVEAQDVNTESGRQGVCRTDPVGGGVC